MSATDAQTDLKMAIDRLREAEALARALREPAEYRAELESIREQVTAAKDRLDAAVEERYRRLRK